MKRKDMDLKKTTKGKIVWCKDLDNSGITCWGISTEIDGEGTIVREVLK